MIFRREWMLPAFTALALLLIPASTAQEDPERTYQLLLGPHFLSPNNMEEPFLNLVKASSGAWQLQDEKDKPAISLGEAIAAGYVNPETGMPVSLPEGARTVRGATFLRGLRDYPDYYAGDYTLEWDGEAHAFLRGQPRDMQTYVGNNKLTIYVQSDKPNGRQLRFSELKGGGVTGIRFYRNKYKKLIEAGEIWNPVFIQHLKKYDIVRTMDFQATNASPVRSFDQIARPDDVFFGNTVRAQWPHPPRYGVPFETLFDLAEKADVKLWMNIPPMIGAPEDITHPSFRLDSNPKAIDAAKVRKMAREIWREILASPEWEKFAAEFTDRLTASSYPPDKPLYIELGNEIWNWAPPFLYHSTYARGIGANMNKKWSMRHGYGVLSARWAAALEAEFNKRGVSYNVTYVLGSHTARPGTTKNAIVGYKYQLGAMNADVDAIVAKTGIALTTYFNCSSPYSKQFFSGLEGAALATAWERAIDEDPEELTRRYYDFCLNGPATLASTKNWILRAWRRHRDVAEKEGMKIIGAYEGGSHDQAPKGVRRSDKFREWWANDHWGARGADVARQINLAIIEEFPDVILANYASIGPTGRAPWFDGHYSHETEMMRMWDEFARPEANP